MTSIERNWTAWADARPSARGLFWWRLPEAVYGGVALRPEWIEEVALHGMGYAESQLWPRFSNWDGYRRTVPAGLEWAPAEETARKGMTLIAFEGLASCPFCGAAVPLLGDDRLKDGGARLYSVPFKPWLFRAACRCGIAATPWRENVAEVLAVWNRRA